MICPFCRNVYGHKKVLQTIVDDDGNIKRRRKCSKCNKNFATIEMVVLRVRKVLMPKKKMDVKLLTEKIGYGHWGAPYRNPLEGQICSAPHINFTPELMMKPRFLTCQFLLKPVEYFLNSTTQLFAKYA